MCFLFLFLKSYFDFENTSVFFEVTNKGNLYYEHLRTDTSQFAAFLGHPVTYRVCNIDRFISTPV